MIYRVCSKTNISTSIYATHSICALHSIYFCYTKIRYIPRCGMRIVPSTTCGGPPPSELKLARRIGFATPQLYSQITRTKSRWYFYLSGLREGARNTTAPCGRYRECELAQRSKLCEVNNEQTILGTTRGQ